MEIIDLYNYNRELTNETVERTNNLPKDRYRLVVHACIFNEKNEMLIQQRSSTKKVWPNLWDISVGGGAVSGETSLDAIKREVLEEVGLNINDLVAPYCVSINYGIGFDDTYIIHTNLKLKDFKMEDGEVQQIKWATKEEIMDLLNNNKFINYKKSYIEFIFESLEFKGALKND
jgi:isopentenyldiphosphate isomerase